MIHMMILILRQLVGDDLEVEHSVTFLSLRYIALYLASPHTLARVSIGQPTRETYPSKTLPRDIQKKTFVFSTQQVGDLEM